MTDALTGPQQRELADRAGGARVSFDPAERLTYGYDNSRRQAMPDAVAWPETAGQVQGIVRFCREHGVALIPRGLASNTVGATVPVTGGVMLSLEHMGAVRSVRGGDRYCVVEPGVTNARLQSALDEHGFFWPPDPTSAAYATVGGNLACNAAGPRTVKYGTPRENTLGLVAVTGTGELLRTGVHTTKGVVGYDLTRLLIGSEGTLGIITEATLKLTPQPEAKRCLRAVYRDVASAARAVSDVMAQPVTPCALEFMDDRAVALVRDIGGEALADEAGAMLLIEVDGAAATLAEALNPVADAARNDGLIALDRAESNADVQRLWAARKALSPSLRKVAPGKINEDVAVPVSRIPALVDGLKRLSDEYGVLIVNFGHAGNGNLHVNLLYDPDDEAESRAAHACLERVFDQVLELDGTLSGEHGVGLAKRPYVERELGAEAIRVMREIKDHFDPAGILNPGKMFPD